MSVIALSHITKDYGGGHGARREGPPRVLQRAFCAREAV